MWDNSQDSDILKIHRTNTNYAETKVFSSQSTHKEATRILRMAQEENIDSARGMVLLLEKSSPQDLVKILEDLLQTADHPLLISAAIAAIGRHGQVSSAKSIERILRRPQAHHEVVVASISALREIGMRAVSMDERAVVVSFLLERLALSERNPSNAGNENGVVVSIVQTLGELRHPWAIEPLGILFKKRHRDLIFADVCLAAFEKLGKSDPAPFIEEHVRWLAQVPRSGEKMADYELNQALRRAKETHSYLEKR